VKILQEAIRKLTVTDIQGLEKARPWLTLKEAAEEVSARINKDPALLRMINALAASIAIEVA
jgi:hypothetical protein